MTAKKANNNLEELDLTKANALIKQFDNYIITNTANSYQGELYTGVDLGTANIVVSVVDSQRRVIAGALRSANVVRDGVVFDYLQSVAIVKELKQQVEQTLGVSLSSASAAIPPGVNDGSVRTICNVVENSGFELDNVVDEPTAAAELLGVYNGAVVDVGGGTTGISIIKNGKVIFSADEATGGHHMSLVLSGAYNIPYDQINKLKHDKKKEDEVYASICPVVEKMATIVKKYIVGFDIEQIYVVGGACSFRQFEHTFEQVIGIKTIKPYQPMLVTPLGIALSSSALKNKTTPAEITSDKIAKKPAPKTKDNALKPKKGQQND